MNALFGLVPDIAASAIWAMVVASLLPLLMALTAKIIGGFSLTDNAHPRDFLQRTTGAAARANAAQQNSYETLPVFLAAVLVARKPRSRGLFHLVASRSGTLGTISLDSAV